MWSVEESTAFRDDSVLLGVGGDDCPTIWCFAGCGGACAGACAGGGFGPFFFVVGLGSYGADFFLDGIGHIPITE